MLSLCSVAARVTRWPLCLLCEGTFSSLLSYFLLGSGGNGLYRMACRRAPGGGPGWVHPGSKLTRAILDTGLGWRWQSREHRTSLPEDGPASGSRVRGGSWVPPRPHPRPHPRPAPAGQLAWNALKTTCDSAIKDSVSTGLMHFLHSFTFIRKEILASLCSSHLPNQTQTIKPLTSWIEFSGQVLINGIFS